MPSVLGWKRRRDLSDGERARGPDYRRGHVAFGEVAQIAAPVRAGKIEAPRDGLEILARGDTRVQGARLGPVGRVDAARAQFGLAGGVGADGVVAFARRLFRHARGDAPAHPGIGEYAALGGGDGAGDGGRFAQARGESGARGQRPVDALLQYLVIDVVERAPGAGVFRQRIDRADNFGEHDFFRADAGHRRVSGDRGFMLRRGGGGPQRRARQRRRAETAWPEPLHARDYAPPPPRAQPAAPGRGRARTVQP